MSAGSDRRRSANQEDGDAPVRTEEDATADLRRQKLALLNDRRTRAIVDRLSVEPASAAEVAADLGLPAEAVRRRLRGLHRRGLIARSGNTRRRGVSEFLYSYDLRRGALWPEELVGISARRLDEAAVEILRQMFRDAIGAVNAGTFTAWDEHISIRFPIPLDKVGFAEAWKLQTELFGAIVEAAERGKERIARADEPPIEACVAILFFEAPAEPWPPPLAAENSRGGSPRRSSTRHPVDAMSGFADPLRRRVADALTLRALSAEELAEQIGVRVEKVRYELSRLQAAGQVKVHSRRPRRGLQTQLYLLDNRNMLLDGAVSSGYDRARVDRLCRDITTVVFREALAAIRSGSFNVPEESVLARIPMGVDLKAFREISTMMDEAVERLFGVRERCLLRCERTGTVPRTFFSDLFLFEQGRASP